MALHTLLLISFILVVAKLLGTVTYSWLVCLLPGFVALQVYMTVFLALKMAKCIIDKENRNAIQNEE